MLSSTPVRGVLRSHTSPRARSDLDADEGDDEAAEAAKGNHHEDVPPRELVRHEGGVRVDPHELDVAEPESGSNEEGEGDL